ncbi:MAG TPA: hypothetical protein VJ972_15430, partial [Anaerolineales bacterium]|nr:hypothetical protein [Anaerolineales bacterium]
AAFLLGLYQRSVLSNTRTLFRQLSIFSAMTAIIVGVIMIVITPLAQFEGFPRTVIFYDIILTGLFFGLTRLGYLGLGADSPKANEETTPIKLFTASWKSWLTEGTIYYGIVLGALSIYMILNKIFFGIYSPVSGQIKRWWGSLSGNVYGGRVQNPLSFFGIDHTGDANAWHPVSSFLGTLSKQISKSAGYNTEIYLILLALFVLILYFILWVDKNKSRSAVRQLGIIPLFCSAWVQALSYHITGYSAFKEWYWVSQMVMTILTFGLIAGILTKSPQKYPAIQSVRWLIVASVALFLGISHTRYVLQVMPYGKSPADSPYNDLAYFLEQHTESGSVIGMTGGGNAGYFISNRIIINMDGLINSYEYFHLLQERKSGEYLAEIGMDYILANPEILGQLPYNRQYEAYYQLTDELYGGKQLIRYRPIQP